MNSFLIILFIVLGYVILLGIVIARSDNRRAIYPLAVGTLLIYGCVVGMLLAVGEYLGETGLVLYAAAAVYSVFYMVWALYSLFTQRPAFRPGELLTLTAYLLAVLYITLFMRVEGSNDRIQMELFHWLLAEPQEHADDFHHVLLNIAMFVPVGGLAALAVRGIRGRFLTSVSFGLFLSALIETLQLILKSGTCDIDDIVANTLGAATGAALAVLWKKRKRGAGV